MGQLAAQRSMAFECVLLIDTGVLDDEMAALANDMRELGQPVVAGFSTHPHWDHLLWHARLGAAPRYGTARCAATVRVQLSDARWKARITQWIPPDIAEQIPLDLLGLPAETAQIPWDGPQAPDYRASGACPGPCGTVIEERGVLVAGDMGAHAAFGVIRRPKALNTSPSAACRD